MQCASLHAVAISTRPELIPSLTKRELIRQEAYFTMLGLVKKNPNITVAEISKRLGVSSGMVHYVLRSLIDKGSVKVQNFSKNPNKRNYSYNLTPAGLSEKMKLMVVFLERKRKEYYALQKEIRALEKSVEADDGLSKNV